MRLSIRVLIADDQSMVRTGFRVFLETQEDIEVVGEAGNGEQAVLQSTKLMPDVVLMDVRMPVMDGLEATRRILSPAETPNPVEKRPRVLIVTTFDLDDYVYEALRAGASGFILKDASAHKLVEAVRVVAAGDALLAPSITKKLISTFARWGGPPAPSQKQLEELTAREMDVFRLVSHGRSNAEIAAELVVSEETVKTHVSLILSKLDLRDRAQAIVFAYESGFLTPHGP